MQSFTLALIGLAIFGFALTSIVSFLRPSKSSNNDKKFPGPTQLPLIGRVHDLPIEYMWLKFKEWADQYGPIYFTSMLGTKFVVVSDEKMAEELLVKRAKIYSDRPAVRSLFDSKSTHGSMEYLPLMGKNQYWARQRRWTHASLTQASNASYYGVVDFEVKRWLYRLVTSPDDFCFSLEDMASKVTCTLTWDNPDLSEYNSKSAWGLLTQMSPAGPITNLITPLWHLPLAINPWKTAEHKRHDDQQAWWMARLVETRDKMAKRQQRPCWTRQYLETAKTSNLTCDYEASSCIGMLAIVGVFTIGGPLHYFLMAMVLHPEWQMKVQREVDTVCGDRLPTLNDYANLPVLRACIKETMRWRPNVPTGVAHEAEADDWYRGYFIEKGTRILPLDWAFLRNPVKYPDPDSFRPERWLSPEWPTFQTPLTTYPTVKGMTSFGWGQRACLGQTLTQDEMLVACGAVCWGFNMAHKINPVTGKPIAIDTNKSNSLLIVKPDPFEMKIEPRTQERREQMLSLWADAEAQDVVEREAFLAASRPTPA